MNSKLFCLIGVAAGLSATAAFADTPALLASHVSYNTTATPSASGPRLQLEVSVPASMYPMFEDDVAAAFADRISTALKAQGFKGQIVYVDPADQPASDQPVLAVNLFEWRYDRVGTVECTFTTKLTTEKGKTDLGMFTGMAPALMQTRHDPLGREDQFDDAASQAMSGLLNRINQTHLIN